MSVVVLENSVEEFVARFSAFAASGVLYPQAEGSPLVEFAAGGRVLYLFDRTGPYAVRPGDGRVIVHAEAEATEVTEEREEALTLLGVSAVEGVGEVLDVLRGFLVVRARLPIVLGSHAPWPGVRVGDWVRFRTVPPLHGFVLNGH